MTRHRRFRFVLFISILLSVLVLATNAQAQTKERFVVDTGIIALPSTHELRITVATASVSDTMTAGFRRLRYSDVTCNSNAVCVHEIGLDDSFAPVTIAQGEAASFRVSGLAPYPGVRVMVLTNNRDVRVTAQLINQSTGEIVTIWVPQGSPVVAKP